MEKETRVPCQITLDGEEAKISEEIRISIHPNHIPFLPAKKYKQKCVLMWIFECNFVENTFKINLENCGQVLKKTLTPFIYEYK